MLSAALVVLAGLPQADSGEQYFKFKPGTTWSFTQTQSGTTSKAILTVLKDEGGKVTVESKEFREEGQAARTSTIVWSVTDGFLIWEESRQGKQVLRVYKLGSKKDDTWKASDTEGRQMDAFHLGTEEVKVPAGLYKDVVHLQVKPAQAPTPFTLDIYLAPKVGPIKMGGTFGDQKMVMELTDFKEGK